MSSFSQQQAQNVLEATLGQDTYSPPVAPVKVKLMSVTPTESSAGTEITAGGGYTAGGVAVSFNAATAQTGTFSGRIGNQALTIANMPAATVNGIDIVDSTAITPRRLMWGALTTARTTSAGDTLSFPADSIVAQA